MPQPGTDLESPEHGPARLGAYRVGRELGRGGMGIVYAAERDDGQFQRRVAIKVLRTSDDPDLRMRVLAERQILAALDHPGIARLLDGGVSADGAPYLVMEYVDGLPVDAYCDHMGLPLRERLRLFVDIARIVDHAHRNLVVHRDLKPSNIFVTPDGRPKLLDFGVAKLLNHGLGSIASHTLYNRVALTPEYASPEQLRGEALTTLSDVYALGGLLFELLTGRRPFAGRSLAALVQAVCEKDAPRPSDIVLRGTEQPSLDGTSVVIDASVAARSRQSTPSRLSRELRGDLDAIVLQALSREPRHRYGSAELLARDTENYLDGMPVTAHARGRVYAFGKFVRRHRVPATTVLLAVLSLLAGATASAWQASEARAQRDRATAALTESDQVTEFLIELFAAGEADVPLLDAVSARDLLRRGSERIDELDSQPRVQIRVLTALGRVHEGLGGYEEGQRLTQRALALQQRHAAASPDDLASLLLQHGILQRRRGLYDSAEVSFAQARDVLDAAARPSPVVRGGVLAQLSSIAIYRGDLTEAERRARAALDVLVRELGETHRLSVYALRDLASVQWRRGLPEAEQNFRLVIRLRAALPGTTPGERMSDRLSLAELLLTERRSLDEAESIFREAMATMRVDELSEFGGAIWSRNSLAQIHGMRGEYGQALELLREVLELHRAVYGAGHPVVGLSHSGIGQQLLRWGRVDEAAAQFDTAALIQQRAFGPRHPSWFGVMVDRARLLAARDDLEGADSIMQSAFDLAAERYGSQLPRIDEIRFRAELRTGMGDYAYAEALLQEAMRRSNAQTSVGSRTAREVHDAFVRLYAAWGRLEDAEHHRTLAGRN